MNFFSNNQVRAFFLLLHKCTKPKFSLRRDWGPPGMREGASFLEHSPCSLLLLWGG